MCAFHFEKASTRPMSGAHVHTGLASFFLAFRLILISHCERSVDQPAGLILRVAVLAEGTRQCPVSLCYGLGSESL